MTDVARLCDHRAGLIVQGRAIPLPNDKADAKPVLGCSAVANYSARTLVPFDGLVYEDITQLHTHTPANRVRV